MTDKLNILDITYGPLSVTGQTTSYAPAGRTTLDDGGQRAGIVGSLSDAQYEILTTGQYSGTTNITVNGKTDTHSNECVFDRIKGLMWSRTQSAGVFGTGAQNLFWEDAATGEDIFNYCDQANAAGLSGFTDWRLPNIRELISLFDYGILSPNVNAFPTVVALVVWSSTTYATLTSVAYTFGLLTGVLSVSNVKNTARVKCMLVR